MRRWLATALLAVLFGPASPAAAATYQVTVTRIDARAYRESSGPYVILTDYCYEYATFEPAVLEYARGSPTNALRFRSGATCGVRGIYRANATLWREGDDLYRSDSGEQIRTSGCFEHALGDRALVLYDRVIFVDRQTSCYRG
jgi:hypothetical protein